MDDCASICEFYVGPDFTVGPHAESDRLPGSPVAGLALLLFLAQFDAAVLAGDVTLVLPPRLN